VATTRAAGPSVSRVAGAVVVVLFVLCGPAGAQDAGSKPTTPAAQDAAGKPTSAAQDTGSAPTPAVQDTASAPTAGPLDGDRAAVTAIVTSAVSEVKLCGLAIERSRNTDVRSLCRKASADNARTAIAGMQLAQSIGATSATLQPSPAARAELDALEQYSGLDFDREFLLNQIEADENAENNLRYAAEVATDSSVKHYENAVLPRVENNLQQAESALRRVSEAAP
jgi:predicted outer membrane protein